MRGSYLHDASYWRNMRGMQRTSFEDMVCPIARSLERVGEWWSMLILRDAFAGKTRFETARINIWITRCWGNPNC